MDWKIKAIYGHEFSDSSLPEFPEPPEDLKEKRIRNFYAELLNGAMVDLKLGLSNPVKLIYTQRRRVKNRKKAIEWFYGDRAKITFVDCCNALEICPELTRKSLILQGLLPDKIKD